MNLSKSLCALAVAAAFAFVPATSIAEGSHSHASLAHKLTLDNGQKWKVDEPLRRGMESIRDQVAAMHEAAERAPLKAEYYRSLGLSIDNDIAGIVRDCKLDPRADANFHVLLGQLAAAAESLKGHDAHRGMKQAREALEHYGRYFDHPDWQRRA